MRRESDRVAARVRALLREHGDEQTPDLTHVFTPELTREPAGPVGPAAPAAPERWHRWRRLTARLRLDPGRSAAMGIGVAVLVAAVVSGWWLLSQRPQSVPVRSAGAPLSSAPTPVGTALPSATSPARTASAGRVVVDVAGKVRRPGLYRLADGARVDDAIRAAGGALRGVDLSSLNLAARVVDGQQILVGSRAAGGAPPAPVADPAGTASPAPVSLNTATLDQLETLPGIGPVLAQNILDWRTANGGFSSIDQLTAVSGIGDVTFAELRPLVTL